jgi:hypothetical protein
MALSLTGRELADALSVWQLVSIAPNYRYGDRRFRGLLKSLLYTSISHGVLNAFRNDLENTEIEKPTHNVDISGRFASRDMSAVGSKLSSFYFLSAVRCSGKVRTNRLHVGIASALLRKSVHLYDNSYGKNHDVYRHSLSDVPNVSFRG